jgi:hypothetical protein
MIEASGYLPPPLPKIEIVDEEPPAYLREAAEKGLADYAAGRYVVCESDEAFEHLLNETAAHPQPN